MQILEVENLFHKRRCTAMPFLKHWLHLLVCFVVVQVTATAFNPLDFKKETAQCKAIRRGEVDEVVDIDLKYVDINPKGKTTLVMVHGWPSLWSTWSNQIQEFKDDYRLIVVELRGFGESEHPGNPQLSGTIGDMVGDIVCTLEHAKVDTAICMGHDWGSSICYEGARVRPDIFKAVIGITVPYMPSAGPFMHMKDIVPMLPKLAYQLFFNSQPEAATQELDKDIRRTVRATLRTVDSPPPSNFLKSDKSFLEAWDEVKEIPPVPFFSVDEEDYFVKQYEIKGFKNSLQLYSQLNRLRHWELVHGQGNHTIIQPVLAIYPTQDPVANWVAATKLLKSEDYLPNLTTETLPGAHWFHIEYPKPFNKVVRKWLDDLLHQTPDHRKPVDEL